MLSIVIFFSTIYLTIAAPASTSQNPQLQNFAYKLSRNISEAIEADGSKSTALWVPKNVDGTLASNGDHTSYTITVYMVPSINCTMLYEGPVTPETCPPRAMWVCGPKFDITGDEVANGGLENVTIRRHSS